MVLLTVLLLTESDRNFMAPAGNMLTAYSKRDCNRPRGLRRGAAAARWLRLLVRSPPGHGCLPRVLCVNYT
jgi:hypothetical protein